MPTLLGSIVGVDATVEAAAVIGLIVPVVVVPGPIVMATLLGRLVEPVVLGPPVTKACARRLPRRYHLVFTSKGPIFVFNWRSDGVAV